MLTLHEVGEKWQRRAARWEPLTATRGGIELVVTSVHAAIEGVNADGTSLKTPACKQKEYIITLSLSLSLFCTTHYLDYIFSNSRQLFGTYCHFLHSLHR